MTFFVLAICLLLLSSFFSLFARTGSGFWGHASFLSLLAGTIIGSGAVCLALIHPEQAFLNLPMPVPGGAFSLTIDGLSAVFLFPAFLIIAAGAIYAEGYWPQKADPASGSYVRFFYGILAAGIVTLLATDNAVLFLLAWECMALCGFFLVCTERAREEVRTAGFLYLTATHTGTLALFALFSLFGETSGVLSMPAAASLDASRPEAAAIFFLALFGFGLKAGIMPLHIWLPRAHAAAPSHVSALMSGVMIKTGIYGIMRITTFYSAIPAWWGWTILCLGGISAVLGVVLAIAQHDIKRLLAYHSVENIGIILLGFGIALLGASQGQAALFSLGLAGSLLHVVNHGLFKALLFFSAGSIIHATGTRELTRYGGLLRTMPLTGLFFLGGAVAICGLPPLNGFVSEWLIYLGLLHAVKSSSNYLALASLAVPALAMTGGLAVLCFTKVFGLSFLGSRRTSASTAEHEAPGSMLLAMAILLAACLGIGLLPALVLPLLTAGISAWSLGLAHPEQMLAALAPAGMISLAAILLALLLGAIALLPAFFGKKSVETGPTWGCGYGFGNSRMQYTASSFAQGMSDLFYWALRTKSHGLRVQGVFPAPVSAATHSPDMILDLLVTPFCRLFARGVEKIRPFFQHGIIGLYLLLMAVTLCLLLLLVVSSQ